MIQERYYKIHVGDETFFAIVTESDHDCRLQFGGTKECVNIRIYTYNQNANIEGISYDVRCNANENLLPGDGTCRMAECAMVFARKMFPKFTVKFYFTDYSKIHCQEDIDIPLYWHYLIKHGKTWYQTKFKAIPVNKERQMYIEEALDYMKDPSTKIPFDKFSRKYLKLSRIRNISALLKEDYECSNSYFDFMHRIISISKYDCGVLRVWFNLLWVENCRFNFAEELWQMRKSFLNSLDMKYERILTFEKVRNKPKCTRVIEQGGGFFPLGFKS